MPVLQTRNRPFKASIDDDKRVRFPIRCAINESKLTPVRTSVFDIALR